jgi:hypothetical protein
MCPSRHPSRIWRGRPSARRSGRPPRLRPRYVPSAQAGLDNTFPRFIDFSRYRAATLKIAYHKDKTHFPLNIATDRKGVDFEFYVSFSGREASVEQCDAYEKGDMVKVYQPNVKNFRCAEVISVYMTSPKQVQVAVSHFYSSRCGL